MSAAALSYTMGLPDPSDTSFALHGDRPVRHLHRNILIAGSVVLFHMAALWALQSGLLRRVVEVVVPIAVLSDIVTPPQPRTEPAKPPPKPPEPVRQPPARQAEPVPAPAPQPLAVPSPAPAPQAPTGTTQPMPALPPIAAPVTPAPAPARPAAVAPAPAPAPPRVELPSSAAAYLQNPAPAYPPISKRLGEQGKVLVRVLIGQDGMPQKAEIKQSSGFDRLDRSALDYVMRCRYVPGKVGGVPQAMWYDAPVNFILE